MMPAKVAGAGIPGISRRTAENQAPGEAVFVFLASSVISRRLPFVLSCGAASVISSTPFLNVALASSAFTDSGSGN